MSFKQFLVENIARNNALKQQQELIDAGEKNIEVTKLPGGVYALTYASEKLSYFCTPDGRIEHEPIDPNQIMTSAHHAYLYALDVLKGPFPAGENVLATNANHAFHYAKHILNGPFPAGEKMIAVRAPYAYHYAEYILKGPFPAAEKMLAADANHAFHYAKHVLKAPFPAGEEAIMSSGFKAEYETFLASLKK